jgi:AraC-like DNA-binding protein/mannose-6-phosphate isomerase-like protein (cupin superfamily)
MFIFDDSCHNTMMKPSRRKSQSMRARRPSWFGVSAKLLPQSRRMTVKPGEVCRVSRQRTFVLWLIAGGRGRVVVEGRARDVTIDTSILVPAGARGTLEALGEAAVDLFEVVFNLEISEGPVHDAMAWVDLKGMTMALPGVYEVSLYCRAQSLSMGQNLIRAKARPADLAQLEGMIQLLRMFYLLRQSLEFPERAQPAEAVKTPTRRAYVYLLDHRNKPELGLKEVADFVGLSVAHLGALFRKEFGASMMKVLTRERMVLARRLLLKPEFKVTEVAEACGYASSGYFCRAFRRWHGASPGEYRESVTQEAV